MSASIPGVRATVSLDVVDFESLGHFVASVGAGRLAYFLVGLADGFRARGGADQSGAMRYVAEALSKVRGNEVKGFIRELNARLNPDEAAR